MHIHMDPCRLPELASLRAELEAEGCFSAVFMTGSGSTIVGVGSDRPPACLTGRDDLFVSPARLIVRSAGKWYEPSKAAQTTAAR